MNNKEAIDILKQQKYPYPEHYKDIEVNEAIDLAIRSLKFIEENCPKTFIDYLNGEQI